MEPKIFYVCKVLSQKDNLQKELKNYRSEIEDYFQFDNSFELFSYVIGKYHKKKRRTGEPEILHPVNVANFLKEHNASDSAIITGLIHDILEDEFKRKYEELKKYQITYLNRKYFQKKDSKQLEEKIEQIYSEISNSDTKNKEIEAITNILDNSEKIIEYMKVISFAYKIPKYDNDELISLEKEYHFNRYKNYIADIINYSETHYNLVSDVNNALCFLPDLVPIQVKIADRDHNTRTLRGLDMSRVIRAISKNEILISQISEEIQNDRLTLDELTRSMLEDFKKTLEIEKNKDYKNLIIVREFQKELNETTDKILEDIKKINTKNSEF